MKVLVTGGNGFIGSNLIKRLLKEGYTVHSLDNLSTGLKSNEVEGCHYHYGDIGSVGVMDKDIDIIFHLAAASRVQPSFKDPYDTYRVNVTGTMDVLEFAKKINAKVIYAGSSSRWHDHYSSPYALTKYLGEEVCKMYKKIYNLNTSIARFYNVYGPGESIGHEWSNVIGIWRGQIRDGLPITIVGDGEQRRDFTYVDDIVDGLYKIANTNISHSDAWELGTGINYSINEMFDMFQTKFKVEKVHIPDQPGNYRTTLRENNDTLTLLGWKPQDKLLYYIQNL